MPGIDLDLRGLTNIRELVAVVDGAAVVVTTDTGILHLSGALQRPTLALCPVSLYPVAASQDYTPLLALLGVTAGEIPAKRVAEGFRAVVAASRTLWAVAGPAREADGPADVGRIAAGADGVPYRTLEEARDAGWWHVVEGIEADAAQIAELDLSRCVLSEHVGLPGIVSQVPGVLFRGRGVMGLEGHLARRGAYCPLPVKWDGVGVPACRNAIGWHGVVHERKNLRELVGAVEQIGAHLTVCGSVVEGHSDAATVEYLKRASSTHVSVLLRPYWSDADLRCALGGCAALCYPDTVDKEQSAASQAVLGLGRPVVVGVSTAHDEVRGWCITAKPGGLPQALLRALGDLGDGLHGDDAMSAGLGASYRTPSLIARQYRAMVQQCALDAYVSSAGGPM